MAYFKTILAFCVVVFAVFAFYKFAPFLFDKAVDGSNYVGSLIESL